MSDTTSLVPVSSAPPVARSAAVVISPSARLSGLKPYKVTDFAAGCVYSFLRVGCTPGTHQRGSLSDPKTPRQFAMVTLWRDKPTFTLSYFPLEGEAQIVKDLPLDQISQAVEDLIGAGFASDSPTPPSAPPPELPALPV